LAKNVTLHLFGHHILYFIIYLSYRNLEFVWACAHMNKKLSSYCPLKSCCAFKQAASDFPEIAHWFACPRYYNGCELHKDVSLNNLVFVPEQNNGNV